MHPNRPSRRRRRNLMNIRRNLANRNGVLSYEPDDPCKHGHESPRYSKTGACIECERLRRGRLPIR